MYSNFISIDDISNLAVSKFKLGPMQQSAVSVEYQHNVLELVQMDSKRPRFARELWFQMLDAADEQGVVGPLIDVKGGRYPSREALARIMFVDKRTGARYDARKARIRDKITQQVRQEVLEGSLKLPKEMREVYINNRIEDELYEQSIQTMENNISAIISEFKHKGLVEDMPYVGTFTSHEHRGGGRHAVYRLNPAAVRKMRMRPTGKQWEMDL